MEEHPVAEKPTPKNLDDPFADFEMPGWKFWYKSFVVFIMLIGAVRGCGNHSDGVVMVNGNGTGCDYHSVWDYHPGRVAVCELLRLRFKEAKPQSVSECPKL